MSKRIISFFLAVTMVMSLFGFSLSAQENTVGRIEYENVVTEPQHAVQFRIVDIPAGVAHLTLTLRNPYTGTSFPPTIFIVEDGGVVSGRFYTGGPVPTGYFLHVAGETRDRWTVTFVDDGEEVLVVRVYDGETATLPTVVRHGYDFLGWSSNGVTIPATATTTPPITADITFTAQWEEEDTDVDVALITFSLYAANGTLAATRVEGNTTIPVLPNTYHPVGEPITFIATPNAGFRVAGWSVNGQGFGPGVNPVWPVTPTGLDVQVRFEPIPPTVVGRFPPVVGVERETGPGHTRPGQRTFPEVEGPDDVAAPDGWLCLCFRRPPFSNRVASEWFDDVALGQWYHNHVSVALSNDAFRGVAPRVFAPQTTMSRAMFAQVLFNLVSCCNDIGLYWNQPSPFTDVTQDDWFFPVINWAYANGLISGVGGGRFAPNDPVTREQMAALLNRFADAENITFPSGATPAFTDQATISSWAVADVQAIQGAGIVGGFPDGSFRPQGNATRAEVATIFAGFLNMVQAQYAGQ